MRVGIINYGSGNLHSAQKAFAKICGPRHVALIDSVEALADAERIVLPGVGAFGDCARALRALPGMEDALCKYVQDTKRPFLGICVGMQLMATRGQEHGTHAGLDWMTGDIAPLAPPDAAYKIPHIGWNDIHLTQTHPVLDGLDGAHFYFVHSCAAAATTPGGLATCTHGVDFCAIWGRDNMIGTQFHPEKSQANGLRLLDNFLRWQPA